MLYSRTNKNQTVIELLRVEEIAFVRAKLEDKKFKVLIMLKCGQPVHMNLDKDEMEKLSEASKEDMSRPLFDGVFRNPPGEYPDLDPTTSKVPDWLNKPEEVSDRKSE